MEWWDLTLHWLVQLEFTALDIFRSIANATNVLDKLLRAFWGFLRWSWQITVGECMLFSLSSTFLKYFDENNMHNCTWVFLLKDIGVYSLLSSSLLSMDMIVIVLCSLYLYQQMISVYRVQEHYGRLIFSFLFVSAFKVL